MLPELCCPEYLNVIFGKDGLNRGKLMKVLCWVIVVGLSVVSCSGFRLAKIKNAEGIKIELKQQLDGVAGESNLRSISFRIGYLYNEPIGHRPELIMKFDLLENRNGKIDSSLSFVLDNELISLNTEQTPKQDSLLKKQNITSNCRRFQIPENLWIPLQYCKALSYQVSIDSKEIKIALNENELNAVKVFLTQIIERRKIAFPSLAPGQKKL